jgi:hypothetical protein
MILLPAVLRPYRFSYILPLAAFAATTLFLIIATAAFAQERYRSPEDAVAALVGDNRLGPDPPQCHRKESRLPKEQRRRS